jgi:hypothetical protein
MNKRQLFTMMAMIMFTAVSGFAQTEPSPNAHWSGTVKALRPIDMTLDLGRNNEGVWIGSISLPFFGQVDVPLEKISIEGSTVRFSAAGANYDGRMSADGNTFSGSVLASIGAAPFELTRNGAANVKVPPPSSPLSKELEGTWSGAVKTSSQSLRVVLTMAADADGRATGMAKAVDAGNQEFPIATIIQTGRQLEFEIRGAIHVTFSGSLDESGTQITGIWKEGTDSLPFMAQRTKP